MLVSTTTAMFHPDYISLTYNKLIIGERISSNKMSSMGNCVVVAASRYNKETKKLLGYSSAYIDYLSKLSCFDFILIEADGAKHKSIKAPDIHEPIIPKTTTTVVGCIGLDSIGKFINDNNVHRAKLFLSLCDNITSNIVTEEYILSLIFSDKGLFKNVRKATNKIVFLNKADNINLIEKGRKIAFAIKKKCLNINIDWTIIACLKKDKNPIICIL